MKIDSRVYEFLERTYNILPVQVRAIMILNDGSDALNYQEKQRLVGIILDDKNFAARFALTTLAACYATA